MAKLLPEERETIIFFNDGEDTARIVSCQPTFVRQMREVWGEGERRTPKGMRNPTFCWEIPKEQVKVPRPKSRGRVKAASKAAEARWRQKDAQEHENGV